MLSLAVALASARNSALHQRDPVGVAIFSLEMSAGQLAQRLLTSEARVDAQAARTGRLSDDDWPKLARAAGRLSSAPIFIDDTPGLSILELRAKCRRLKAEHDLPPSDKAREAKQIERLEWLSKEADLDPEFAKKFLNFIIQEVIQHHRQQQK